MCDMMLHYAALVIVLATSLVASIPTSVGVAKRSIDINAAIAHVDELPLPRLVTVNGYHLELQPLMEEGKFKGKVKINITCQEPTSTITVHADPKLRIVSKPPVEISVREIVGEDELLAEQPIQVVGTRRDLEKQWFTINLAQDLKRTSMYQVELRFAGDLVTDKSDAFFRGSYVDAASGEKRWYVATKMSPTNARRVFPCFDEPMLKVPIQLSVARPENMAALSVMPVKNSVNSTVEPGWVWDHFERSPVMPTFSFGLVVTDLPQLMSAKTPNSNGGVNIRIFGREEMKPGMIKALNLVPKIVAFGQDYLNMSFPLPELNIITLPNFTELEAADHWGLIIYSESDLVADQGKWSLAYEIMDQWIGHLVTPHWWSDLRVANGLSDYLAITCLLKTVCPESWKPSSLYSVYYELSRPHPFASIPTLKEKLRVQSTLWLFRMLNFTLGEKTFRRGIQNFVQERKHETFFEDDVWSSLSEQGHLDESLEPSIRVETISRTWMNEDRFPVVSVTRDYKENSAHIEQHMFLRTRPHDEADKKRLAWWIPIMYLSPDNITVGANRPAAWMKGENDIDIYNLPLEEDFIVVNPDEIGMFMVNYDERNWELLSYYLIDGGHGDVSRLDAGVRAKLLHDSWNLAYGGELSFATALNMTLFLEFERDYDVWYVMFTMIDHVGRGIRHTDAGKKFEEYIRRLVIPMYEDIGEEELGESKTKTGLRAIAKHLLCASNYKPCTEKAEALYESWMQEADPDAGNPVPEASLCQVFRWGSTEQWKFGLQRLINLPSNRTQQERSNFLRSLAGCPRQPEKVEIFLNVTILEGNGNFTDDDVRLALLMLTGDAVGYTTLFNFLKNNWDAVKQRYEAKPHMWEYVVNIAVGSFKTQEGLNSVSELYAEKKGQFGIAEPIILEKMKKVIEEAKWTNTALPVMEAWLDDKLSQETKY